MQLFYSLSVVLLLNDFYFISAQQRHINIKNSKSLLVKGKVTGLYVLEGGLRRKVPNPKTAYHLENSLGEIISLPDDAINAIPAGAPMPSWESPKKLYLNHQNEFITISKLLSPSLHNPSIVTWNGKFLMSFRASSNSTLDPFKFTSDRIQFTLLNQSFGISYKNPHYLKSIDGSYIFGEDPRLFYFNKTLYIIYNCINISISSYRQLFISAVKYENNDFYALLPITLDFEHDAFGRDQKNWIPFTYQNKLLLIYSIYPHKILSTSKTKHPERARADCIALSRLEADNFTWPYGELRGGSPAVRIGNIYLSFFHSSTRGYASKWWATTYFMGAYTFSTSPPFHILSISSEPIIVKGFYRGPWTSSHTDYVTFPVAILMYRNILGKYQQDSLLLVCGRQDREAWIIEMNIDNLLHSLVPVASIPVGQVRWESLE